MCCLLRLRSIGKLKVAMHGPMNFANSVLSNEGQATHEQLAAKRAPKPKAAGAARRVWVCGTAAPLGWRIQGTSSNFCTKKHGHLGNCFED